MEDAGCRALATTSAGFGRAIGKADQEVTRDELVAQVADLTAFISVPLNVDSERLFPELDGGLPESIRMLAAAGAAGISIEDYDPASQAIDPIGEAVSAVESAVAECAKYGLLLTARAENHLYGRDDLADTITRLEAYRDAGADVLYAPGLVNTDKIESVVGIGLPVNVLAISGGPSVPELAQLGVRRVSVGSGLYNAAARRVKDGVRELIESGTSTYGL